MSQASPSEDANADLDVRSANNNENVGGLLALQLGKEQQETKLLKCFLNLILYWKHHFIWETRMTETHIWDTRMAETHI